MKLKPGKRAELERLSTFLKGLRASSMRKLFNQNTWYFREGQQEGVGLPKEGSCFTQACAGGWLDILSGGKVGIVAATKKRLTVPGYDSEYHNDMYRKLKNYLGLSMEHIEFIFGTGDYSGEIEDVSPLTVAKHIDQVLKEIK